ncbi:BFRF3 [Macacine gammaherpesvirus 4]|uniref:Small capsomere-interacting protein n=1 Tax=Macacine gammaherpesvirus 4 TaxID=45455 RepID=Q9IHZ9_9GAMA|nr:BFRF3 [Macacine gammaherpesvirus 4]AAF91242.2 BFRF3 [Macacine gammaherpesvirus 4]
MARRLPKPTLQGRLEADFQDSPLLPKFQELQQGNLPNDVFREAQRSYLAFLTAQSCYEEYVQRTFGVPRRQRGLDKRQRAGGAAQVSHSHPAGAASAAQGQQAQPVAGGGLAGAAAAASAPAATPAVSSSISSLRAATSGAAASSAAVDTGSGGGAQPQDTSTRGARKKQ